MLDDLVFESLTIEELAKQLSYIGDELHLNRGVWWKKVKPFFYQPAFFFQAMKAKKYSPNWLKTLIGYHYVVSNPNGANASFKVFMHKNVNKYSFDKLSSKTRTGIRKALRFLEAKKITNLKDLLTSGYDTYVSNRKRTNWGRNKTKYHIFSQWIIKEFRLEKRFFLGIYFKDKLIAFSHPYAVGGVADTAFIISNTDYLGYRPNDLLLHSFLTICKNSPDVNVACLGPSSSKPSLDRFKMKFGFELIEYPTYVWINPLVKPLIRNFYRNKYRQLYGF